MNAVVVVDIGGTSLFGRCGYAWSALLKIIVIQSLAKGLTLLNLSLSLCLISGATFTIAVIVDPMACQSQVSHCRA